MAEFYRDGELSIRNMEQGDAKILYDTFASYGWHPQLETYERYFEQQRQGTRIVFIAEYRGAVAGICTLVLRPTEGPWAGQACPEIQDLCVFLHLRKNGIGNRLLDAAEAEATLYSGRVCLAVGVHSGYGAAQRIYVKRGYNFDGSGLWYKGKPLGQYEPCVNDDELLLFMSKELVNDGIIYNGDRRPL